jgi:hypothetical protein
VANRRFLRVSGVFSGKSPPEGPKRRVSGYLLIGDRFQELRSGILLLLVLGPG